MRCVVIYFDCWHSYRYLLGKTQSCNKRKKLEQGFSNTWNRYGKFCINSLKNFIEQKPLVYEEWAKSSHSVIAGLERNWPVLKLNLSPSQMVTPIITTQPNRLSCWAPFVLCPRPLRAFIKIQLMSCTSLTLTNWAAIAAALCLHHIFGVACIALGKGYSPAISVVKTYILGLGSWTTTQRAHGTLLITFKRTM